MVDAAGAPIDRYVVLEHLSEGGMGAIYVGKKLGAGGFEMEVVLKQLLPEFTQQEEFIDLFLREAKLSATLDHANIVHTIDLVTAGGEYFIVMEYLPGGDLRTLLKKAKRRGRRFSPAAAIRIAREVLAALAYAHVKRDFDGQPLKLIHRDVSPSNILLSHAGEVKLTDFGIAKAATHTSLFYKVKGKVGYMSPEQARSEPLDHRSDLYSLAVCLYEILTGERLFVHVGLTTSAEEIYSQPVPSVARKVPGLPADLDAIIRKALSLSAADRYQTAGELNEALTRCAHRHGLLMSAPELEAELAAACGPVDGWRSEDDDDEPAEDAGQRPGTEVYDVNGSDDEDEDGDDLGLGSVSAHSVARGLVRTPTITPQPPVIAGLPLRQKTEVGKFQGVELTSIINMMDLENDGAQPLVDLSPGVAQDLGGSRREGARRNEVESVATYLPDTPPGGEPALRPADPTYPSYPQVQREQAPREAAPRRPRRRSVIRPWMVIALILLAAAVVTAVVALSGPDVMQHDAT